MQSYKVELATIQRMLEEFVESGKIDAGKLSLLDKIIKWSEEDQFRVLNKSYLSLNAQRSFFGAIRNVNVSLKSMKERLKGAADIHENPKIAELALELMPSFFNLAPFIDSFNSGEVSAKKAENVSKFSRILYKKAKSFGFSQDTITQLREAGITESQVKSFVDNFSKNVALELEIEEEESSTLENTD